MSTFVSFVQVNKRVAERNRETMDKAVTEINRLLQAADALPVRVPCALFSDIPSVHTELLRRMRDESGWRNMEIEVDGQVVPRTLATPLPVRPNSFYLFNGSPM